MREVDYPDSGDTFSSTGRALALLSYLLIVLALIPIPLALIAAASGEAAWAWIAGGCAVALLLLGGSLWKWQAHQKAKAHPESRDREISTEGKGPLEI
ncbi:hypothetical protein IEU95_08820 [Hoyosella rhizosphaerae]|uniref:Uncharacterized protein n=1 Tax=Hoyosella rhizosphaerae TaxID=1755582 RepID=A0A916U0E9_9ACTN|nr:hypothetical protein [Hoyosella rhizosphaerae]MBN4926932.1 hypothetical protein [Hoyosella rhizosphaerae]GGC55382.1 hypothetical protein GCM10011410_04710 [Hoyosella rhizosphaerae]